MKSRAITVNIPHKLTQEQARERLEKGFAELRNKYAGKIADVRETWTGNHMDLHLKAMGQEVSGRIDVEPQSVRVEVDLPWLFAMLAEKFRPTIEQEGRKMLAEKT